MKVVMLFNPSSGGGARMKEVARLSEMAAEDGHDVVEVKVGPHLEGAALRTALTGAGALVIAGGDGTVHHALEEAVRSGVPIYHVPMGTENLFAREFGMTGNPTVLRRLLGEPRTRRVDLGECNGRMFALMCSVGSDAAVIHRLDAARTGSISHWSYLRPIFAEFRRAPSRVWAALDGQVVVDGERGMLIVANSRQYAWRIDPAPNADMGDGLLDVVFIPAEGNIRLSLWLLKARLRRHLRSAGCIYLLGREVRIETDETGPPASAQADGEPFCTVGDASGCEPALDIIVRPGALNVLAP